jgi:hemoglobin
MNTETFWMDFRKLRILSDIDCIQMKLEIKKLPFGERPSENRPNLEIYNYLGEDGIRKLVSDHYELLIKSDIKHLFPITGDALEQAKKRSADFFIQRLGGPDYYNQTRGNPMLATRHAPFKITPSDRIIWLDCYKQLLPDIPAPEHLIVEYWNWLNDFSNFMVNTPESFLLTK